MAELARLVGAKIVVAALCAALLIGWFGTSMKDTSAIVHEAAAAANFWLESPGVRNDRDCGDFERREDAQAFFEAHRHHTDPHELDADNDRNACEDYEY